MCSGLSERTRAGDHDGCQHVSDGALPHQRAMRLATRLGLGCTWPFGFLIFNMRVAKGNRSGQESILLPQPDSTVLFLPFDRTQNNSCTRTMSPGGGQREFIMRLSWGSALPAFISHRGLRGRKSGRPRGHLCPSSPSNTEHWKDEEAAATLARPGLSHSQRGGISPDLLKL